MANMKAPRNIPFGEGTKVMSISKDWYLHQKSYNFSVETLYYREGK